MDQSYKELLNIWKLMIRRHSKPRANIRQIPICDEWKVFDNFYSWAKEIYPLKGGIRRKTREIGFQPDNCYFHQRRQSKPLTLEQKIAKLYNNKIKGIKKSKFGISDDLGNKEVFIEWARPLFQDGFVIRRLDYNLPYSKENCVLCDPNEAAVVEKKSPKTRRNRKRTVLREEAMGCRLNLIRKERQGRYKIFPEWHDKNKFFQWYLANYKPGHKLQSINKTYYGPDTCYFKYVGKDLGVKDRRRYNLIYHTWHNRKINMSMEWKEDFLVFFEWSKEKWFPKAFLLRKDLTKPYSPENCFYGRQIDVDMTEAIRKMQETCLKKYGYISGSTPGRRERMAAYFMEKYGFDWPSKIPAAIEKSKRTKIKNGTFGKPTVVTLEQQNQIRDYILSLGISTKNDRIILDGKEIDIYSPELKIGIEYCGIYWHCDKFSKGKFQHHFKYRECKKQGVRLITIFSDEWLQRKEQVKGFLRSVFDKNEVKIHARKCIVRAIPHEDAMVFINAYHIQKLNKHPRISLGLFHNEELVSVMTLDRHHRGRNEWVLNRLAIKHNHSIRGGASKLLASATEWAKENGIQKIFSWSDNRWSYGNVYKKLGFEEVTESGPDYSYVSLILKTRMLKQKFMDKDETAESLKKAGLCKIWDCGKIKWSYQVK